MGRRARGAPRVPRLMGVAVLERGLPGPRLAAIPGDCPVGAELMPGCKSPEMDEK